MASAYLYNSLAWKPTESDRLQRVEVIWTKKGLFFLLDKNFQGCPQSCLGQPKEVWFGLQSKDVTELFLFNADHD